MIIDHIKHISFYEPMAAGITEAWNAIQAMLQEKGDIDVQILLEGQEEMAWMELDNLTEAIPYDEEKDAARWNGERTHHMLITKDMFYIAYPHDGHKAVSHVDEKNTFTKIILKLPV